MAQPYYPLYIFKGCISFKSPKHCAGPDILGALVMLRHALHFLRTVKVSGITVAEKFYSGCPLKQKRNCVINHFLFEGHVT